MRRSPKKRPKKRPADAAGDSSDPVRLYLKEMGNFQLLSREQEVEIAKRIEAGENEVEEEVLQSPVTLDFLIKLGDRIEAGEADLRDIFEENEEPADPDEERGPEANEKQLKKLHDSTKKLKTCAPSSKRSKRNCASGPGRSAKPKLENAVRADASERVKAELHHDGAVAPRPRDRHLRDAPSARASARVAADHPALRGCDRPHQDPANLREAAEAEDRRHVLKVNGTRENLLDIAARIQAKHSAP